MGRSKTWLSLTGGGGGVGRGLLSRSGTYNDRSARQQTGARARVKSASETQTHTRLWQERPGDWLPARIRPSRAAYYAYISTSTVPYHCESLKHWTTAPHPLVQSILGVGRGRPALEAPQKPPWPPEVHLRLLETLFAFAPLSFLEPVSTTLLFTCITERHSLPNNTPQDASCAHALCPLKHDTYQSPREPVRQRHFSSIRHPHFHL